MKVLNSPFPWLKKAAALVGANSAFPSAEFRTVSEARQPRVALSVEHALPAKLAGHTAPGRESGVKTLIAKLGAPDFYDSVARLDPNSASDWIEMGRVQREFAASESKYDPKTRAYSESMRLTLQTALVLHFAQPPTEKGISLYQRFIELHPTAFHQNGGWLDNMQIPLSGAVDVAAATPFTMYRRADGLLAGSFIVDRPTEVAAQLVREGRAAALRGWGP